MNQWATNPGFEHLQPYPFEKLNRLLGDVTPPAHLTPIALSIGEPKHAPPADVLASYQQHLLDGVSRYPTIKAIPALREACASWLDRRFAVSVDPERMIQPVNGTREALFAIAQTLIDPGQQPIVMLPNPFYQIYEGAALMAGARLHYLNALPEQDFLPDLQAIPKAALDATRLFYLCSPVNPCGTVASLDYLKKLIALADKHDFVIVADECYIELYRNTPPVSILNACNAIGREQFDRVLAFHSLSKRSNLPGLRSGFVAGDPVLIDLFTRYRTYHGCSMSLAVQQASITAWQDDDHVTDNRRLYNQKYAAVVPLLSPHMQITTPPASFYLWPNVGGDDVTLCRDLYAATNVTCVPGSYLSRDVDGINPGTGFLRLSLVASIEDTIEAAERIANYFANQGA